MSAKLKLYELTASPNNAKVRIALGYKGLEYDREPVTLETFPGDRSAVAKLSRQPRLPVLQHGETIVFDSRGIMRYLEANFADTPRIFRDDYAEHGEIENWETFAGTQISEPIGMLFNEAFSEKSDPDVIAKAGSMLNDRLGVVEDKLSAGEFLFADHLTSADITVASPLYLADLNDESAKVHPVAEFFHRNLRFDEGREKTRAWVRRVLAYDEVLGRR